MTFLRWYVMAMLFSSVIQAHEPALDEEKDSILAQSKLTQLMAGFACGAARAELLIKPAIGDSLTSWFVGNIVCAYLGLHDAYEAALDHYNVRNKSWFNLGHRLATFSCFCVKRQVRLAPVGSLVVTWHVV